MHFYYNFNHTSTHLRHETCARAPHYMTTHMSFLPLVLRVNGSNLKCFWLALVPVFVFDFLSEPPTLPMPVYVCCARGCGWVYCIWRFRICHDGHRPLSRNTWIMANGMGWRLNRCNRQILCFTLSTPIHKPTKASEYNDAHIHT